LDARFLAGNQAFCPVVDTLGRFVFFFRFSFLVFISSANFPQQIFAKCPFFTAIEAIAAGVLERTVSSSPAYPYWVFPLGPPPPSFAVFAEG